MKLAEEREAKAAKTSNDALPAARTTATLFHLGPDGRHNRPISARFPARVKVVIGGAPMTLLSHRGDPNARGATDAARLLQSSFLAEVSQFRTKEEYCSQSRPTGTSLSTLAGNFRQLVQSR